MQTFLPYNNFYKSAKVLDQKRLGKQRVESKLQRKVHLTKDGKIILADICGILKINTTILML